MPNRLEQLTRALAFFIQRLRESGLKDQGLQILLKINESDLSDAEKLLQEEA